ncbi:MAG: M20/M25/M40 family metallo-hydrolase [Sphingomonadales bacterium]
MRRSIFAAMALTTMVFSPAQAEELRLSKHDKEIADKLIETGLSDDLAYQLLESLTTEVGPRLAGSAQDQKAVSWAVNQLKTLGFDKVWTEDFTFDGWARGKEYGNIISPYSQSVHLTALGNSAPTPDDGLSGEIIAFHDVTDLMRAEPQSVAGKIVYLSKRATRTQNGSGYGPTVINRANGASEAAKLGAKAVIIRSVGTDSHRLPHTGGLRYQEGIKKIPAAALSNPDADLLENMLARGKPVKFNLVITPRFTGKMTTQNVIAEVRGTKRPDEIVVIGGHLDSWDLGTGAIDDGAGVAISTAAAKYILDLPKNQRPERTIRVILWGAEEIGIVGAQAYAKAHADELDKHVLAWESDFGAGAIWKINSNIGSASVDAFKELAHPLSPLGIDYGDNQGKPEPDVIPLKAAGVPFAQFAQDGTDYFDLHHTADDTFDKVNPADLAQNVAAYTAFAYLVANSDIDFRAAD